MNLLEQNYFKWFDLPWSFPIDQIKLRQAYQSLQKIYHPDRLSGQTDQERMQSLQICANLNEAYRVLQNSVATADYCLSLFGTQSDEQEMLTDSTFLMQQFEWRERLESLKSTDELIQFETEINSAAKVTESELWDLLNQKNWQLAKQKRNELHYFVKLQEEIDFLLEKQLESTF